MQLYHFPSPNPQKVTFALKELGLDCEIVPVDLGKGEHRQPAFLAVNPFGRASRPKPASSMHYREQIREARSRS